MTHEEMTGKLTQTKADQQNGLTHNNADAKMDRPMETPPLPTKAHDDSARTQPGNGQLAAKAEGKPTVKRDLRFDDAVIAKIAGTTAGGIDGLLRLEGGMFHDMTGFLRKGEDPKAGVSVDVDDDQRVRVELDATMKYGEAAPQIFDQVTKAICRNVKEMTGLEVVEVKMTVKDMLTDDEIAAEQAKAERKDDEDKDLQPA